MSVGLIGRKCGMTRIFTEAGVSIPVTVIEVVANKVVQVKTEETDGYNALQITAGACRPSRVTKPEAGHFAKANVEAGNVLKEFRIQGQDLENYKQGDELTVELFEEGQKVDVQGVSKGKGFQGGIKRHNFSHQRNSHGNSLSHRALGSTGMCQTPGRVFKGKKMPGQMGNKKCTVQGQQVVRVDKERNVILVKGTVPGAPGGKVVIIPSVKEKAKKGGVK
jgi:large subunit ribosomal protein L3